MPALSGTVFTMKEKKVPKTSAVMLGILNQRSEQEKKKPKTTKKNERKIRRRQTL